MTDENTTESGEEGDTGLGEIPQIPRGVQSAEFSEKVADEKVTESGREDGSDIEEIPQTLREVQSAGLSGKMADENNAESEREGDNGIGGLPQVPRGVQTAGPSEKAVPAIMDPSTPTDSIFVNQSLRRFAVLQSAFVVILLLVAVALLTFWLFTEIVGLVATIRSFPVAGEIICWTILAAILSALGYALTRLLVGLVKLKRGSQVRYRRVQYLQNASYGADELRMAKRELEDFCQEYRKNWDKQREVLSKKGNSKEGELDVLKKDLDRLLLDSASVNSDVWIEECRTNVLVKLDEVSKQCIKRRAGIVSLKTAASPWKLFDAASVLYHCTSMIADLMEIYRRRPGKMDTCVILIWVIGQTYLGAEIQEKFESAFDSIESSLEQHLGEGFGAVAGNLAGGLGSRIAEGAANGLLVYRLGLQSMKLLQRLSSK